MGGVSRGSNQALLLSRARPSGDMEVIPLVSWETAVSVAWWGQKHDGVGSGLGGEEAVTIYIGNSIRSFAIQGT